MKLSEMNSNRFVAILFGKPKSGKTVLASQFPNPWFIDLDKGLKSVVTIRAIKGLKFDFDVTVIDETPTTDPDFIKLCGKSFSGMQPWLKVKKMVEMLVKGMPVDSTLVIDSLTKAGEFLLKYITNSTGHKMQIQDWGTFMDEMLELFGTLLSDKGRCNVIVIAHENIEKDELTGAIEKCILVPGSSSKRLPTLVDEYWYLDAKSRLTKNGRVLERTLRNIPDKMVAVGSRSWMPDIKDPSYDKVKSYLEKSLGRKLPEGTWNM